MKRFLSLLLAFVLMLTMIACGGDENTFIDELYGLPVELRNAVEIADKLYTLGTYVGVKSATLRGGLEFDYEDVDFFGYSGKLAVSIYYNNAETIEDVYFNWEYDKGDLKKADIEKVYKAIEKKLTAKYGKSESGKDSLEGTIYWEDDYYNKIFLENKRGIITVSGGIKY